jgi:hypothetical protein
MTGSGIFNGQDGTSESGDANPNNKTTVRVYQVLIWLSSKESSSSPFIITFISNVNLDGYSPLVFATVGFSASSDWNKPNIV